MYKMFILPVLSALSQGDAEKAHRLAIWGMRRLQKSPGILKLVAEWSGADGAPRPTTVWGITFPNRIGLAAGFDKHAEVIPFLQALGFGFLELGTVLPRPQRGDDRPRVFRLAKHKAIINRMGFNSDGAEVVEKRLAKVRPKIKIPIGISVGKMKETPNEKAAKDYGMAAAILHAYGDYLAANASSPNTPELRKLLTKEFLAPFVHSVVLGEASRALSFKQKVRPVLIKVSPLPDSTEKEGEETIATCVEEGASGIIIGNTTLGRPVPPSKKASESGGFSGPQTFKNTVKFLQMVRRRYPLFPVIAVGGVNSAERMRVLLGEGANLG